MKVVNIHGCHWIADQLTRILKAGTDKPSLKQAMAYAEEAEYQMSIGNPPCIEIRSWYTSSGHTEEFEIPEEYIEVEEVS